MCSGTTCFCFVIIILVTRFTRGQGCWLLVACSCFGGSAEDERPLALMSIVLLHFRPDSVFWQGVQGHSTNGGALALPLEL